MMDTNPHPKRLDDRLSDDLLAALRSQSKSDGEVFASLQQELRRIARAKMRSERLDHTLQPTALVNEAYLKIFKSDLPAGFWDEPSRALRLVSRTMDQILNDYADAHKAAKRGGAYKQRVPYDEEQAHDFGDRDKMTRLDSALLVKAEHSEELLAVREALFMLRQTSPRQAQVVQLQFYGGLNQVETAALLAMSVETVKLDWRKARAFLRAHIQGKKHS